MAIIINCYYVNIRWETSQLKDQAADNSNPLDNLLHSKEKNRHTVCAY